MLGLPGDYTPPSRFVRTVALPAKTHAQGPQTASPVSNAISFPESPGRLVMGNRAVAQREGLDPHGKLPAGHGAGRGSYGSSRIMEQLPDRDQGKQILPISSVLS